MKYYRPLLKGSSQHASYRRYADGWPESAVLDEQLHAAGEQGRKLIYGFHIAAGKLGAKSRRGHQTWGCKRTLVTCQEEAMSLLSQSSHGGPTHVPTKWQHTPSTTPANPVPPRVLTLKLPYFQKTDNLTILKLFKAVSGFLASIERWEGVAVSV